MSQSFVSVSGLFFSIFFVVLIFGFFSLILAYEIRKGKISTLIVFLLMSFWSLAILCPFAVFVRNKGYDSGYSAGVRDRVGELSEDSGDPEDSHSLEVNEIYELVGHHRFVTGADFRTVAQFAVSLRKRDGEVLHYQMMRLPPPLFKRTTDSAGTPQYQPFPQPLAAEEPGGPHQIPILREEDSE